MRRDTNPRLEVNIDGSHRTSSTADAINRSRKGKDDIFLRENITLNGLYFQYQEKAPCVLQNINIKIRTSSKIGLIGTTGSGKALY